MAVEQGTKEVTMLVTGTVIVVTTGSGSDRVDVMLIIGGTTVEVTFIIGGTTVEVMCAIGETEVPLAWHPPLQDVIVTVLVVKAVV